MAPSEEVVTGWFDDHRAFLWGLSYRITGSAADADDVVQETFIRAFQHAPDHLENARRWLIHVAVNAARDVLRRRKRRAYIGPWLPTPIETDDYEGPPSFEPMVGGRSAEGRYDLLESVSLAFLQALEALTPTQRATLLLRDVFDYSAAEVAAVLDTSEGNIRTIHHRARRAMESYEQHRSLPTAVNRARTEKSLQQFLALLSEGDVHGIERMLTADVRTVTDAGGEFTALFRPLVGRSAVAQFFGQFGGARRRGHVSVNVTLRSINGFPTADLVIESPQGRRPPRMLLSIDVDPSGLIAGVRVMANTRKLAAVRRLPVS